MQLEQDLTVITCAANGLVPLGYRLFLSREMNFKNFTETIEIMCKVYSVVWDFMAEERQVFGELVHF